MDALFQVIISIGTLAVAAVVAVVVGGRRGLGDVEDRTDAEVSRLVAALERRVNLLTTELAEAVTRATEYEAKIGELEFQVSQLRQDLALEQRITRRLTTPRAKT